MATEYDVNDDAMAQARKLIDDGQVDRETEWSDAAPSTDDGNDVIESEGWETFGRWHLGIDPEASEETKARFAFPYGNFETVNRAALIHGKQRASQNDHDDLVEAFDDLLQRVDATSDDD